MKKYYPFTDDFIEQVRKANDFLTEKNYEEKIIEGSWEISINYISNQAKVCHSFGDRDRYFNTTVVIDNLEFGLWEWLAAKGITSYEGITRNQINSKEELIDVIVKSSKCLQDSLDSILNSDDEVFNKIKLARKKRLDEWDRKWN